MISHSLVAVEYLGHTFTRALDGVGVFYLGIALKIRKGFSHNENSAVLDMCKPRGQCGAYSKACLCTLRLQIK